MSADQVIEDVEQIRKDLFKDNPNTKILLYGRSGGACLIQRYLAKYSEFVSRAFIRAAPNPIIMKQLGYTASQYFFNTLYARDANPPLPFGSDSSGISEHDPEIVWAIVNL